MTKPTVRETHLDELPGDIRQRVAVDFGTEQADEIYCYLLDRIPEGLPNGTRPRHLRCILHLAQGDQQKLDEYIEMCLLDPRDVMSLAEYKIDNIDDYIRTRDFSAPFDQSVIQLWWRSLGHPALLRWWKGQMPRFGFKQLFPCITLMAIGVALLRFAFNPIAMEDETTQGTAIGPVVLVLGILLLGG